MCNSLKGLSHEIFGPVYWPGWMHLGLNKNRFWFLNFKKLLRYEAAILSFYAFQLNLLGDSQNLREGLATEDLVANPSPRIGDSVANHSRRFCDKYLHPKQRFSEYC